MYSLWMCMIYVYLMYFSQVFHTGIVFLGGVRWVERGFGREVLSFSFVFCLNIHKTNGLKNLVISDYVATHKWAELNNINQQYHVSPPTIPPLPILGQLAQRPRYGRSYDFTLTLKH